MPSHAERFCITIWLDGLDVNRYDRHALHIHSAHMEDRNTLENFTMSGGDLTSLTPQESWNHLACTRDTFH